MPPGNKPAAEIDIDAALVRELLETQHPDLAALPLREAASGWDNVIYRLGDELAVRLPRRELGVELVRNEQTWLPRLAAHLPLPISAPARIGIAGEGFPWPWSICPWFEGESAAVSPPRNAEQAAHALGAFVAALHQPAPPDAPRNPFRGVPLATRQDVFDERVAALGDRIDRTRVVATWSRALAAPVHQAAPLWLHGDLHPGNLIMRAGALAAVIDFGDLGAGDPATDLGVAWMLFDPPERDTFRAAVGQLDPSTWDRARGWALSHTLAILTHSADDPTMSAMAEKTLVRVLADKSD